MNHEDLRMPPTHSQLSLQREEIGWCWEGGGGEKKSLIRGLSHWVCRVNPFAGPSVVLLLSDVTAQGLAAGAEACGVGGKWHLLNSVM